MSASDHRSLPIYYLNLYLYALMAWGVGLLGLYATGFIAYGIPACSVLWIWQAGVTLVWGRFVVKAHNAGELSRPEVDAGVKSVGKILAGSSLLPAILFLGHDPMDPVVISTCIGSLVVAGAAWGLVNAVGRLSNRYAHVAALAIAGMALPINTSGAVTVATMVGVWDTVVDVAPTPDLPLGKKSPLRGRGDRK